MAVGCWMSFTGVLKSELWKAEGQRVRGRENGNDDKEKVVRKAI